MSLNTRAGEARRRMSTRRTSSGPDSCMWRMSDLGSVLAFVFWLHRISFPVFPIWGQNSAEMATDEAAFDLLQLVDIFRAAISYKSPWRSPTTSRACQTSVPLLCIKDETRWQITVARAALNLPIVLQSCCPVIYSRRLASASVFGLFNAPFTESITFSHKNMTLQARAHASASAGGSERRDGRGRGRAREPGMDGGTDG